MLVFCLIFPPESPGCISFEKLLEVEREHLLFFLDFSLDILVNEGFKKGHPLIDGILLLLVEPDIVELQLDKFDFLHLFLIVVALGLVVLDCAFDCIDDIF